ncbi:hypothetical protein H257_14261 [Aphanomyces astaci]|uniref:Uncharacterized protein n=1 Tax=Aphanomyces astaci TaxID=112090 RepID=W4FU96_APHAT|nr:hypothetical protein H257_14261 [Aphanomyces astaci]ETV70233.1 hypothetical protein H257_14261 [Aphanomyces astaci]|eukprot:XP_009840329.1 hypothetical protein H257_14261 [Aphanomyces astaci]
MPPTFTVWDTTPLPFVLTVAPMSRPNHDVDSYPSSGTYGQQLGVGYTQPSTRDTGSGPGADTRVVTQVERILPHLGDHDMVDPSGAEVTLRDLLVVEDPDMEDTEGTKVVLLALREADPEETALVPDSPTHPWSPVRFHVVNARKNAANGIATMLPGAACNAKARDFLVIEGSYYFLRTP